MRSYFVFLGDVNAFTLWENIIMTEKEIEREGGGGVNTNRILQLQVLGRERHDVILIACKCTLLGAIWENNLVRQHVCI